ncbi:lysozyme inhibitor LprI family protein [Curvibacter sp. APW13]|uniref:lysozyme inhibitor LprI family protein n=1 Tax=Curvibacter sp. APW13 TaxID=3077236 RepID=UPI0028DD7E9C|nr:lysozyme inhibitor LprI family protein [Curvibacter sp. APW13]MDT8989687.1 lysozyme inhibitor LprI family protein [Curvibacter sp. APW13]
MTLPIIVRQLTMRSHRLIRCLLVLLALAAISQSAMSREGDFIFAEKQKAICSAGGQSEMNQCMAIEYRKVDRRLNSLYMELTSVLEDARGIRASQRAWLKYRDAECSDDVMQLGQGSLQPYAYHSCMIEFTEERIRHLRWHLAQDCNGCPARK